MMDDGRWHGCSLGLPRTHSLLPPYPQLKKQIQKARIAKGWTQSQLAQAINETPRVIQDYENGKAVPNPQVLNKMSRVLGTTLSNKAKPAAAKK